MTSTVSVKSEWLKRFSPMPTTFRRWLRQSFLTEKWDDAADWLLLPDGNVLKFYDGDMEPSVLPERYFIDVYMNQIPKQDYSRLPDGLIVNIELSEYLKLKEIEKREEDKCKN